jgi:glycosyltransferase involved in cell wall biosynthesis
MSREPRPPLISVIIPTLNRAPLLRRSLESLVDQTLSPDDFEVVVVDDGSTDATSEVCEEFATRLRLRYYYIKNSGNPAAKNLGVFAAAGPLILFFDDDDIATRTLLEEHLRAHSQYPGENVAILGYTCWAPELHITPVMEYVMDIGQFLFAYKNLRHGQELDYTYFWCGRISCKRSLLVRHGVYNQFFPSIIEDVELGYRLSRVNLRVIFSRQAISHMVRPITYEDFCRRCERVGAALSLFSRLHPGPVVDRYCKVNEAKTSWEKVKKDLGTGFYRVREIESLLEFHPERRVAESLRAELHKLYKWTFDGFKMKGIVQQEEQLAGAAVGTPAPVVQPIVVYQMGKVGSKSVEASLRAHGVNAPICHCHLLADLDRVEAAVRKSRANPVQTLVQIDRGKQLRKTLLGSSYIQCRVISLVRDPVARNISAFFQNIDEFIPDYRDQIAAGNLTVENLIETFLTYYDHNIPVNWFDKQFKPVFGIDVFADSFPKEQGYAIYHGQGSSLLLIKLEKLNECAAAAVKDFLGIDNFILNNTNVGDDKEYRGLYRDFIASVRLPPSYLDQMYESRAIRHFYSDDEIQRFRTRWARQLAPAASHAG